MVSRFRPVCVLSLKASEASSEKKRSSCSPDCGPGASVMVWKTANNGANVQARASMPLKEFRYMSTGKGGAS